MHEPLFRLYRTKLLLLAVLLTVVGMAMLIAGHLMASMGRWHWLSNWPITDVGSALFTTGLLGVAWQYVDGRDGEIRDTERLKRVLADSAPEMRDAVVRGFAVHPEDLQRVATPELLDQIATNVLSLRLGDQQFASELYAEIRGQAVRAPERWHDVQVSISLSTAVERNASGVPLLDVLVDWEYTTVPSHSVARFACTSDRDEFYELVTDVPATSTWFMTPRPGLHASDKESFELLYYAVDGQERKIRRSERRAGQTYSATIGEDAVRAAKPVRIKHVYRTVTPASGHRIFVEVPQPTRGFSLEMDYTDTDVSHMSVTELVSSTQRAQVTRLPGQTKAKVLSLDLTGWLLPKSGFAFVWTLASEDVPADSVPAATPASTTASRRLPSNPHRS